jgi:hypothetical protein
VTTREFTTAADELEAPITYRVKYEGVDGEEVAPHGAFTSGAAAFDCYFAEVLRPDDDNIARVYVTYDDGDDEHVVAGHNVVRTPNLPDGLALDAIAQMLRDPEWACGMLEDTADFVRRTGRSVMNLPGDPTTWDRH